MNVYDTANTLAQEIKKSEEYVNYKMAKETIKMNANLSEEIKKFEQMRYEVQIMAMQTGKNDEEKFKQMQETYGKLLEQPEAKAYFEAETKFNILVADVNKIIGEAIRDVIQ